MSRKHFIIRLLMTILLSACGSAAATQAASVPPVTEAPAATEAAAAQPLTTVSEPQFTSVSTEAASPADMSLYQSLSAMQAAPLNQVALAVSIKNRYP